MESVEIKKFTGKARERREYSGLDIVLENGCSFFTYYLFITSFEYIPSDGNEPETLKITSCDFKIIIKGRNLIPIKNDLKAKVIDTLQAGKEHRNVNGELSFVDEIEVK